jgi:hypothetical protein
MILLPSVSLFTNKQNESVKDGPKPENPAQTTRSGNPAMILVFWARKSTSSAENKMLAAGMNNLKTKRSSWKFVLVRKETGNAILVSITRRWKRRAFQ